MEFSSQLISFDRRFAEQIYNTLQENHPQMKNFTRIQHEKCVRDILFHLDFLNQAMGSETPGFFRDYVLWARVVIDSRDIADSVMQKFLQAVSQTLSRIATPNLIQEIQPYLDIASEALIHSPDASQTSAIVPGMPHFEEAKEYLDAVLGTERRAVLMKVQDFLQKGLTLEEIYQDVFQPVQREIGRLWQLQEIDVSEDHFATALSQLGMVKMYPQIFTADRTAFRLVSACVSSELHEMGIRMVNDFFKMAGWETHYLGANILPKDIVAAIEQYDADLLALSITMSSQVTQLRDLVADIRKDLDRDIKILVGGYPFNVDPSAWQVVGAVGNMPDEKSTIDSAFKVLTF